MKTGYWLRSLLLSVLATAACASGQRVSVTTTPSGADVYLERSGKLEVAANVAGISGTVEASSFTDDYIFLGTSPVEYTFKLSERQGELETVQVAGNVTKRYTDGMLRIEMAGYRTVERLVAFSGSAIHLDILLELEGNP